MMTILEIRTKIEDILYCMAGLPESPLKDSARWEIKYLERLLEEAKTEEKGK